jgi:glycosyltransferase involved in cell wall biosynthesis
MGVESDESLEGMHRRLAALDHRLRHAMAEIGQANALIAEAEDQARSAQEEAEAAKREAALLRDHLSLLEASTIWRLSAPLRNIGRDFPGLLRFLRRVCRLARPLQPQLTAPQGSTASIGDPAPDATSLAPLLAGPRQQRGAEECGSNKKIILIVDHAVPRPDQDAGSRAILDVMTCLVEIGWLISFWPQNRLWDENYTAALEVLGIAVFDSRWSGDINSWLTQHATSLDHVLISRATVALDLAMAIAAQVPAPLTYFGHDIAFLRLRQQGKVQQSPKVMVEAQCMEALERRLWRFFDSVIYLSEEEAGVVRLLEPAADARFIVPFCYDDFLERQQAPASRTILFVAGFAHAPNADAATFLAFEVLPLVHERCPEARLALVGSHPTAAIRALVGPRVEVTGWISDEALAQRYRESRVAVAPLRFGAGVKGKVVQALQQGLPLVVTPVGAQGIPGLGDIVPVQQEPHEIAEALLTLLQDDAAWMAQSRGQVGFAKDRYARSVMRASVVLALEPDDVSCGHSLNF